MNETNMHSWFARILLCVSLAGVSSCAPEHGEGSVDAPSSASLVQLDDHAPAEVEHKWFSTLLETDDGPPVNSGFGLSVALSGNTALVAAPSISTVYVFVLSDNGWDEQATLEPPVDFADGQFGASVAISGDTAIVGAPNTDFAVPGAAYVYERSGTTWSAPRLLDAGDRKADDRFGWSVALTGDTAVVGAPAATGVEEFEGAVYVFTRSGSTWAKTRKLSPDADRYPYNEFGFAVAISETTVLVGAPLAPSSNFQGRAYAYARSDWHEQQLALAEPYCCDEFGHSVALDGDVAVVGAWSHRGSLDAEQLGYRQGGAFVFTKATSNEFERIHRLFANDAEDLDAFGTAVAVSGNRIMVGAPGQGTILPAADSVYVFDLPTGPVVQDRIGVRGQISFFGGALALEGDTAVVGTLYGRHGAYVLERLAVDGSPCDSNLDCRARHCVDGVCCDTECAGGCEMCPLGTCTALPELSPGSPSCSPYLCGESGGECPERCRAHVGCVDTHYCNEGICAERLPIGGSCRDARDCESGRCDDGACAGVRTLGARCSSSIDCASGFCVDGYCCDLRCDGQCEACDLSRSRGTCSPVSGAPHGEREPCAGTDTPCEGACDGEHTVICAYPTTSTLCGSSCEDDEFTESFCNGQGECETGEARSCGNFACDDEFTCKTSCTVKEDCAAGATCHDGNCELGATCVDKDTAQGADGTIQECAPFFCDSGSCQDSCEDSDDCARDHACQDSLCVPIAARSTSAANESGGCSVVGPRSRGAGAWLLCVALFAACAIRRTRGSSPRVTS